MSVSYIGKCSEQLLKKYSPHLVSWHPKLGSLRMFVLVNKKTAILTKACNFFLITSVTNHDLEPHISTAIMQALKIFIFISKCMLLDLQMFFSLQKVCLAFCILFSTSAYAAPSFAVWLPNYMKFWTYWMMFLPGLIGGSDLAQTSTSLVFPRLTNFLEAYNTLNDRRVIFHLSNHRHLMNEWTWLR
jgi:hypothetical protein